MALPRPATLDDPEIVIARRLVGSAGHVSGQALGAELGLSRTIVGRHVGALRRQGWQIDASTRLGYRLRGAPDGSLAPARVLSALRTEWLGRRYLYAASCSSTSDLAAEAARAGEPEGLVVVADAQTAGRGRLGRRWFSPPRGNVYVSILLRPEAPPASAPPLALAAGAALAEVVAAVGGVPRLKWPNDLLLPTPGGLRKAGGILIEMASEMDRIRHVVVGIGLDVAAGDLPEDLRSVATSIEASIGRSCPRALLLVALLEAMERVYDRVRREGPAAAVALWRPWGQLGGRCRVLGPSGPIDGVAEDVDPDGALRIRDDAGLCHRIVAGEVGPASL